MSNLKIEAKYSHAGLEIKLITDGHTILEVLQAVEGVILASGYYINHGSLQIVDSDASDERDEVIA